MTKQISSSTPLQVGKEISRPIARDDRIHIEYVPTQVVTEYVRNTLSVEGKPIDGIRYASSRNNSGTAIVLFADQDNLVLEKNEQKDYYGLSSDRWISLLEASTKSVSKIDIDKWARVDGQWSLF